MRNRLWQAPMILLIGGMFLTPEVGATATLQYYTHEKTTTEAAPEVFPSCVATLASEDLTFRWTLQNPNPSSFPMVRPSHFNPATANEIWIVDQVAEGEADRWSIILRDQLEDREVWRKDDLSPIETPAVPKSLLKPGHLYQLETVRRLKSGESFTEQNLIDFDAPAMLTNSGYSLSLDHSLYHTLETAGAVAARLTLKEERTGAVLLQPTIIQPETGLLVNGKHRVAIRLADYLHPSNLGAQIAVTWEELDQLGKVLVSAADPLAFRLRPSYQPRWKEPLPHLIGLDGSLEWQPMEGARWFRLVLQQEGQQPVVRATLAASTTRYSLPAGLAPGPYTVALAAEGPMCSQNWTIQTVILDKLPFEGILSPSDSAAFADNDLGIELRTPEWLSEYLVELVDVKSGERLQVRNWYKGDSGPAVHFDTSQLLPDQRYRVRATADGRFGAAMVDEVTLTYQPPLRLSFKQPAPGARVSLTDLPVAWARVPGAQQYELFLTTVGPWLNLQRRVDRTADTLSVIPVKALESGRSYRLLLVVTLADGRKLTSEPLSFSVR